MTIEVRDSLRNSVLETLMNAFPQAQKVSGGIAFMSDVLDDETGKFLPVEIKVSVKNVVDTARSAAYDLDAEVAKFAARPGRRIADPEKVIAREKAAANREAALGILRNWVAANDVVGMTTTQIQEAVPGFEDTRVTYVGSLLKSLCEEGVIHFDLNENRKKIYSK